jgi:thiamine pyrophosphate-dependent acetolactate synthase large subunit-like protein
MPQALEIAMQTAVSRRGISNIALPGDVALRDAVVGRPRLTFRAEPLCPSDDEIAALAGSEWRQAGHDLRRRRLRRRTPS